MAGSETGRGGTRVLGSTGCICRYFSALKLCVISISGGETSRLVGSDNVSFILSNNYIPGGVGSLGVSKGASRGSTRLVRGCLVGSLAFSSCSRGRCTLFIYSVGNSGAPSVHSTARVLGG